VHILAKSAARQWGPEGIAVNALAVAPETVLADPAVAGPVSIASPAVPHAEVGDVLAFLCSRAAASLAGQTLTVDGGLWM
jgi:3-oxoacyl-[acyl-carrier protein] reductase